MNEGQGRVDEQIEILPVGGKGTEGRVATLDAFIEVAYEINSDDPNWVPPLRREMRELLTPGKNPFFEHARHQFFLARRGERTVGRISAHIDELALTQPPEQGFGPGTGFWGLFEATDEHVAAALIARAEEWLRAEGMTRALGPVSMSIWEEPGLLVKGHDHPPMMMMGHHQAAYQSWIEGLGYATAKRLLTYDLDVTRGFRPIVDRIVKSGERNPSITIRSVDKSRFEEETQVILSILNEAWSKNWGFVPFTESEKAYGAKKLKPITLEGANMIAEVDGEPAAFMISWPDINPLLAGMKGRLLPFNWARLLWWLRKPRSLNFRVPLMGVVTKYQNTRLASQLAFMMIEYIRRNAVHKFGAKRSEVGWVLEDNKGMVAIADAIGSKNNREYRIYEKAL